MTRALKTQRVMRSPVKWLSSQLPAHPHHLPSKPRPDNRTGIYKSYDKSADARSIENVARETLTKPYLRHTQSSDSLVQTPSTHPTLKSSCRVREPGSRSARNVSSRSNRLRDFLAVVRFLLSKIHRKLSLLNWMC
jgi:hypothetical protein